MPKSALPWNQTAATSVAPAHRSMQLRKRELAEPYTPREKVNKNDITAHKTREDDLRNACLSIRRSTAGIQSLLISSSSIPRVRPGSHCSRPLVLFFFFWREA